MSSSDGAMSEPPPDEVAAAFGVLGMPCSRESLARVTQEEVKRAFRCAALKVHPDKDKSPRAGHTNDAFICIHEAYRTALRFVQDRGNKGPSDDDWHSPPGAFNILDDQKFRAVVCSAMHIVRTLLTFIFMTASFGLHERRPGVLDAVGGEDGDGGGTSAGDRGADGGGWHGGELGEEPIEISIRVSFDDVYMRRTKKVVILVRRWIQEDARFVTRPQTVLIDLLDLQDSYRIPGIGDDFIAGDAIMRTDAVIRVSCDEHPVFSIDSVYKKTDVHACVKIDPRRYYYGASVAIELPGSQDPVIVDYQKGRRVYVRPGRGLPFTSEEGTLQRGDLYVFFDLSMPDLPMDHLESDLVRLAFDTAFPPPPEAATHPLHFRK